VPTDVDHPLAYGLFGTRGDGGRCRRGSGRVVTIVGVGATAGRDDERSEKYGKKKRRCGARHISLQAVQREINAGVS
jgi:hypothetical protein